MFILLLALWIIFNGSFTAEILIFGIIISAAVCLLLSRLTGYSFKKELKNIRIVPFALAYLLVLICEIIKANVTVAGLVIKGRKKCHAAVCTFKSGLRTNAARTLLADSITLTPGTITVVCENDVFTVHCLDKKLAEGIESSCFVKRLKRMEELL